MLKHSSEAVLENKTRPEITFFRDRLFQILFSERPASLLVYNGRINYIKKASKSMFEYNSEDCIFSGITTKQAFINSTYSFRDVVNRFGYFTDPQTEKNSTFHFRTPLEFAVAYDALLIDDFYEGFGKSLNISLLNKFFRFDCPDLFYFSRRVLEGNLEANPYGSRELLKKIYTDKNLSKIQWDEIDREWLLIKEEIDRDGNP